MKIADEKIVRFERRLDSAIGMMIPGPELALGSAERDGNRQGRDVRSLTIAVAMCIACWVLLGCYLLS
ncbi:hypothetical protein EDF56_1011017 [Novosphingobium sp. PhB165]|uniref:hypothetical protein n=1 Tax=Novosphingobium sp. PhB165 TaxID=2485105 RepID=UPI0010539976|nr:hypothetical protein [Novosphingobium sp. PhB165]TCM22330.1 hypothetical protein EDF56_1011017 [Novosphingobium sp. PhB165]